MVLHVDKTIHNSTHFKEYNNLTIIIRRAKCMIKNLNKMAHDHAGEKWCVRKFPEVFRLWVLKKI